MNHKRKQTLLPNWKTIYGIFQFKPHDTSTTDGQSKERYRRILMTGGSTAIVRIISALVNLVTVPLTVHYLGSERYGLWMAISSVLALMSFADLGLGNGLLNAVSRANGQKNIKDAQIAVSSTFFILLGIAGILALLFMSSYSFVPWEKVFNVKSELAIQESGSTVMVLFFFMFINMPLGVIQRVQDGYQEGYKFQLWLILGSILSLIGLLLCIYFKCGLTLLVMASSSGPLLATIINGFFLFSKRRPYLIPSLKYFDWKIGKQLIKSGLIFFFLGLFTLLGNTSDDIILSQTVGASAVAGYEIVKKIFIFSMFTQFIIQPLWPAFVESIESGDLAWAKKTLRKSLILSILSGAIISLPLLIFGKQIIHLWVGEQFIPSWSLILGFYAYVFIANYGGVMSAFLNSGPLISKQLLISGLAAASSVTLKIVFSLKVGMSGIIWATVVSYLIFFALPSYKIALSYLNGLTSHKKENNEQ